MDSSINENIIEKVKFRDILESLKSIVVGNKSTNDEKLIDAKLQEIYKVEKEMGATASIEKLVKELEMHEEPKKRKTDRSLNKITKSNNTIRENSIKIERNRDKGDIQEERQD